MVMELMEGIMEATMEVMVLFTMHGCKVFLVHLSLASLKGLHPHHNTTILGLQHLKLTRLEMSLPALTPSMLAGILTLEQLIM
jgi:hypothetical protein